MTVLPRGLRAIWWRLVSCPCGCGQSRVLYGYGPQGVRCEIIDPAGKPLAQVEDADVLWLETVLP
jgi:hypothetical protein